MKRLPFIVFGTGRCGTTSLHKMLTNCENTSVLREHSPYKVNWYKPDESKLRGLVQWLKKESNKDRLPGSVARYWLPHITYLRKKVPELKLICLHRDKEGTVKSWMQWKAAAKGPKDRLRPKRKHLYDVFPIIDAHTIQQSYEFYWEMYEEWSHSIEGVYHIDMLELNDKTKVEAIFDYLEIPEQDRVFLEKTRYNEGSPETKEE